MSEPTLSVCAIVKNEESNIKDFIENIKDIADEIIITDTGSTDKTVEIIESFNIKTSYYKWDNNFSNARNYCLSHATKDWVLSLDADERVIINNSFKDKLKINNHVYMLNIKHLINNNKDAFFSSSTKLFPNYQDFIYYGAIHEYIDRETIYSKSVLEDIYIIHSGFNKKSPDKITRNKEIIEHSLKLYKKKDDYYKHLLYLAGKEYLFSNEYDKSIYYFEMFINSKPDFNNSNLINAITFIINIFYLKGDYEKLEIYANEYKNLLIKSPDFCITYGIYLSEVLNKHTNAIYYFQKCLYFQNIIGLDYYLSSITYKPNYLIGITYLKINKPNIGVNYLIKALNYKVDYKTIYYAVLSYSYFNCSEAEKLISKYSDILTDKEKLYLKQLIS